VRTARTNRESLQGSASTVTASFGIAGENPFTVSSAGSGAAVVVMVVPFCPETAGASGIGAFAGGEGVELTTALKGDVPDPAFPPTPNGACSPTSLFPGPIPPIPIPSARPTPFACSRGEVTHQEFRCGLCSWRLLSLPAALIASRPLSCCVATLLPLVLLPLLEPCRTGTGPPFACICAKLFFVLSSGLDDVGGVAKNGCWLNVGALSHSLSEGDVPSDSEVAEGEEDMLATELLRETVADGVPRKIEPAGVFKVEGRVSGNALWKSLG